MVSAKLGLILEETPLASNQVLRAPDSDGWRDLSAKVRDNWQLRRWVLAQGEQMVVQVPAELRAPDGAAAEVYLSLIVLCGQYCAEQRHALTLKPVGANETQPTQRE